MFEKFLSSNQQLFVNPFAEAAIQKRKPREPGAPKMIPHVAKAFHNYRPAYYTKVGLVTCTLQKVDVSPVSGETVAYYDLVIRDPLSGQIETDTYLYGIRNGVIREIKKFPTRYKRG